MINILFLFIAYIVDIVIGTLFGFNLVGTGTSLTPNVTFIVLMILCYEETFTSGFLYSFFTGLLFDFMTVDSIVTYSLVFLLSYLVMRAWSTIINDTFFELLLMVMALVFLKEFALFLIAKRSETFIIGINSWAVNHLLLTIIVASVVTVIVLFLRDLVDSIKDIFKYRTKRDDRLSFRNY